MFEGKEEELEKLLAHILENPTKNPELARIKKHLMKQELLPDSGDSSDLESINNDAPNDESSSDEGIGKMLMKKKKSQSSLAMLS